MENEELSERLIELRTRKGLNRRQAAAGMGMPYRTLTNYEYAGRRPMPDQLKVMANFYGVTVDELLGISHEEPEEDQQPDVDYEAMFQMLKEAGLVSEDRKMTDADLRFLQSLICQIEFWFE